MKTEEIAAGINRAVAKVLKIGAEKVSLDDHLVDDLEADSLHLIEIAMEIEDDFGIEITDEEAEVLCTPRQLVDHVTKRMGEGV